MLWHAEQLLHLGLAFRIGREPQPTGTQPQSMGSQQDILCSCSAVFQVKLRASLLLGIATHYDQQWSFVQHFRIGVDLLKLLKQSFVIAHDKMPRLPVLSRWRHDRSLQQLLHLLFRHFFRRKFADAAAIHDDIEHSNYLLTWRSLSLCRLS